MSMRRVNFLACAATVAILLVATQEATASFGSRRDSHTLGLSMSAGLPQLVSGELRISSVPHFDFAAGAGGLPINSFLNSVYAFTPVPIDLQAGETFNLYPSATYSLSSLYAFARWYPGGDGFFFQFSASSVVFTGRLSGSLRNETLGTSTANALSGTITVSQPSVVLGPGYQFLIGDHFHLDLGAGLGMLLPATSSTSLGGSISSFVALNAAASANYESAKTNLANSVNAAMASYQAAVKFYPSLFLTLGYLF